MNRRFTPVAAAMMAAFATPVLFQQPAFAQAAQQTNSLPEVVVRDNAAGEDYAPARSSIGGATPALIRDIPQSVTVINRAVLEAQAASTMTEALRNVPGITISAGEGGNIGDNINLRGFSARTDIFMDGFRDLGQYTRDTFNVEAVEVLKGPSSMLFGRGSTGGVINQVSKKPGLKPVSEVTVGVGTDDYYRTTVDLNRALSDTSAFRVNAFGQSLHSTRDVVENKDWGIAPSLRFGIGTPTEVTLSGLFQRNDDTPDFGFPLVTTNGAGTVRKPVNAPANRFYGYTDDRFEQEVNVLNATIRHKISPTLTLRNQTQVADYTTEASPSPLGAVTRIGGGTPSLNDPLNLLVAPRQDRDRTVRQKSFSNQTDLVARIQAGSMLHTVTTGIEFGRDEYRENRYVWNTANANRNINLGNPVNGTRQGARALSRTVNTTADTLAVYVNDQIDLNKQWKLVGGARWERFKASSTLQKFALPAGFPADTTAAAVPNSDSMFNVRAGVIYQPTDAQSYYLSYGTSSNPSAEAVTQSATTAGLDPEKNRSIEAGAKLDFLNGNLSVNTAVFRVEKTNARTTDPLTALVSLNGNVRVQGIELGVVGRITPAWQVMAGYTFLDGKIVESLDTGTGADAGIRSQGKTLQNTPRHSASIWSTYSFAGNWEAGGGLVYSSDRFVNNFETAMIDGYTRVDATLAYRQKKYDVRLSLQNLTDKKYFESASGGRATPVKGRTAIVTLAYRF
ncbi:TonB-dependent receptor [Noviherbaspirillum sedimenti]|uniref:TonB-dependent siderophore receptor n=1 Tax=Noviherbaspirillum sedimenti TaxID=2320865 RepID=A0A3A3G019_9BURK|nr:TonB-dependent siderophore receptor [Noviherbaspirillum sedimenti]RJG00249.1 TonB-dependent siderophore receptor [Noviherbaspirillum sedimenti]